jgi:predicted ATP-grasp superfamily ATP-dependent carboligase
MRERPRGHVLIAGVTTRALATSAAKAGYTVTAIDAFGDRDLQAIARVIVPCGPEQRYGPLEAAAAGADVAAELVAYTSNFENYPSAVARLAQRRQLLGNPPRVLEKVRNPVELMRTLRHHRVDSPISRLTAPAGHPSLRWMLKPRRSGGGHGVKAWRGGAAIPRTMYLQQRISGPSGSIVFASSGERAIVLGLSRQLIGEPRLGAGGFRYCGSLLAGGGALFHRQTELLERATDLATLVTREFQLVGLNGIDFIARNGVPYLIEVNPRFSASMELIERGQGFSMFDLHASACRGRLPSPTAAADKVYGKAIVFARRSVTISCSPLWEADRDVADLPHEGERIPRGRPICTVFAEAPTADDCHELLLRKAAAIYRATGQQLRQAS